MPTSTFFGLTISGSGLSAYQNAINTTANNVANVQTEGYSRQEVLLEAARALRTNQSYGTVGSGVEVTAIQSIRNIYYDMKYWNATSSLGEYDVKQDYLGQIESYFKDDEQVEGFSTIFSELYTRLETLNSQASQFSARQSYVSSAQSLSTYFQTMANDLQNLQAEINQVIYTDVDKINTIAKKIAQLNKEINIVEQKGGEASELRDERSLLIDDLSKIVPVATEEQKLGDANGAKSYMVTVCGHVLVDAYECNQLRCVPRENKINQSDAEDLYDIYWNERNGELSNTKFEPNSLLMSGELKGLFAIRDGNNNENFRGTISAFHKNVTNLEGENVISVTIKNPSISAIEKISMYSEGTITLGNKEVTYKGYELNQDASGEYYYTFYLDPSVSLDDSDYTRLTNTTASTGSEIDYMGIPYYQSQLNGFLRSFCQKFNTIEQSGYNYYGEKGTNFFTAHNNVDKDQQQYLLDVDGGTAANGDTQIMNSSSKTSYYLLLASNFEVVEEMITDPYKLACSNSSNVDDKENAGLVPDLYKLCTTDKIFRNTASSSFLQCILSDIAVDTQESKIFVTNFTNIQDSITTQRMSVSGVDEDEEALNLVKFQNAYSLSSKVVSILSEIYDRLILETGV